MIALSLLQLKKNIYMYSSSHGSRCINVFVDVQDIADVECEVPDAVQTKANTAGVAKVLSMSQSGHFSEYRHGAFSHRRHPN